MRSLKAEWKHESYDDLMKQHGLRCKGTCGHVFKMKQIWKTVNGYHYTYSSFLGLQYHYRVKRFFRLLLISPSQWKQTVHDWMAEDDTVKSIGA